MLIHRNFPSIGTGALVQEYWIRKDPDDKLEMMKDGIQYWILSKNKGAIVVNYGLFVFKVRTNHSFSSTIGVDISSMFFEDYNEAWIYYQGAIG